MFRKLPRLLSKADCQTLIDTAGELTPDWRITSASHRFGSKGTGCPRIELEIRRSLAFRLDRDLEHIEPVEIVKYEQGARYPLHSDCAWRTHTLLIYLNDDYEGGRTAFPQLGQVIEPEVGLGVLWTNSTDGVQVKEHLHEVLPLVRGEKWVAVCWAGQAVYDESTVSGVAPDIPVTRQL